MAEFNDWRQDAAFLAEEIRAAQLGPFDGTVLRPLASSDMAKPGFAVTYQAVLAALGNGIADTVPYRVTGRRIRSIKNKGLVDGASTNRIALMAATDAQDILEPRRVLPGFQEAEDGATSIAKPHYRYEKFIIPSKLHEFGKLLGRVTVALLNSGAMADPSYLAPLPVRPEEQD